jgi:hypothetical protein
LRALRTGGLILQYRVPATAILRQNRSRASSRGGRLGLEVSPPQVGLHVMPDRQVAPGSVWRQAARRPNKENAIEAAACRDAAVTLLTLPARTARHSLNASRSGGAVRVPTITNPATVMSLPRRTCRL